MKGKLVFVVLGVALYFVFAKSHARVAPDIELPSVPAAMQDSCEGTERCLAVYLAPWCPACKSAGPLVAKLRTLAQEQPDVGMMVIVGREEDEAKLESYAESIGGEVFLDYDQEFHRQMGDSGVPHWYVWDQNRKILASHAGYWVGAGAEKLLLDKLGLASYFSSVSGS